jgi:hypothetical protein
MRATVLLLLTLVLFSGSFGTVFGLVSGPPRGASFTYTHFEVNAQHWLLDSGDIDDGSEEALSVLVDPLVGVLDFDLPPGIYEGRARVLTDAEDTLARMVAAKPQVILITQSWQDHLHAPTLRRLKDELPCGSFLVLAPPSGEKQLRAIFEDPEEREGGEAGGDGSSVVRVLRPGESICEADGDGDGGLRRLLPEGMLRCSFTATEGSLVGPPWSARENGYLCRWASGCGGSGASVGGSVYTEPHSDLRRRNGSLRPKGADGDEAVDIVIAPVVKQALRPNPSSPTAGYGTGGAGGGAGAGAAGGGGGLDDLASFTLVHGGERALSVAAALGASTLIPLANGDIEATGRLAPFVKATGSAAETAELARRRFPAIEVLPPPKPGAPLRVEISSGTGDQK